LHNYSVAEPAFGLLGPEFRTECGRSAKRSATANNRFGVRAQAHVIKEPGNGYLPGAQRVPARNGAGRPGATRVYVGVPRKFQEFDLKVTPREPQGGIAVEYIRAWGYRLVNVVPMAIAIATIASILLFALYADSSSY
jgi:hypothetical protein